MKLALNRVASAVIATGAFWLAASGAAVAGPLFSVDPSAVSLSPMTSVTGNSFSGFSSELLHLFAVGSVAPAAAVTSLTPPFTYADIGWGGGAAPFTGNYAAGFFKINDLTLDSINVDADIDDFYRLYLKFDLVAKLTVGTNGAPGSEYVLTALNFAVFADPLNNTTFTQAGPAAGGANVGTEAVVGSTGDDFLLGVGSLLSGEAKIQLGGVALNAFNAFGVCNGPGTASFGGVVVPQFGCSAAGTAYFFDPSPFYQISLSAFNNTAGNTASHTANGTVSIRNAVGTIDFVSSVPEPGSLALLGVALAGLGLTSRRRKVDSR